MHCEEKKSTIGILLLTGIVMAFIIISVVYRGKHNENCKNEAIERGDSIYLNGQEYCYGSPDEEYTISNILICKTDSGKKVYEIKEYANYEYIAVYSAWDGTIYKKVK